MIVRTLATGHYVTGIITAPEEWREKPIPPVAQVAKGDQTFRETRLPIRHPRIKQPRVQIRYDTPAYGIQRAPVPAEILLDPLYVSSAYRHVETNKLEVADLSLIIEHPQLKNGTRRCLVTVSEMGSPHLTVIIKNYDDDPELFASAEKTPLQRLEKLQARPMSVWERLAADDDE